MGDSPLVDPASSRWNRFATQNLRQVQVDSSVPSRWRLSTFAGRFGEISGDRSSASLTLMFRLVLEAQGLGEPVVWITGEQRVFFPPDVADVGVDLEALPVIRVPGMLAAARSADHLLRSGAFGLVVLDIGSDDHMPIHIQTRLAGLARRHDAALLCITEKEDHRPSVGSLISLRAHTARTTREEDRVRCEAQALKDKRHGPGWCHSEICRGPDGLR